MQPNLKPRLRERLINQIVTETTAFLAEWKLLLKENASWASKLDAQVQLIAEAYIAEQRRLLNDDAGSREWTEIIQQVRLLTYATMDHLLKLKPELEQTAYYFDPDNIEQKAHKLLSGSAYQFGISLRKLETLFPSSVRIVTKKLRCEV